MEVWIWSHVSNGIVVLSVLRGELIGIWGHCAVVILGVLVVLRRLAVIVIIIGESSAIVIIWEPSSPSAVIGIATWISIHVGGHSIRGITHRRVAIRIRISISSSVHWIRGVVIVLRGRIIVAETTVNRAAVFVASAAAAAAVTTVPLHAAQSLQWGISVVHVDLGSSGLDVIVAQKALE